MSYIKKRPESSGPSRKRSSSNRLRPGGKLSELVKAASLKLAKGSADPTIMRLAIDSRRVVPGSLFFALPGLKSDGSRFIDEAVSRGALAVISVKERRFSGYKVAYVKCENPRLALAQIARAFFGEPDRSLSLIGITGTNGKTTVAGLVKGMLSSSGARVGSLGTVGYDLVERSLPSFRTTPEAHDLCELLSQMVDFKCDRAVMEVSSHGIDQLRVAELHYDAAVFLNLTRDHLDYHGEMESYYEVKKQFFTGAIGPKPKHAIINADDAYGRRLLEELEQDAPISFGFDPSANIRAEDLKLGSDGSSFNLVSPKGKTHVALQLVGRYNVSNALAAFATCYALGQRMEDCIQNLKSFDGIAGRMELVETGQKFKVIVDYAHTADALDNALGMLREITKGRLVVVFGCGGDRDRGKRPDMVRVAQEKSDYCWATSDNPRNESVDSIFEDMKKGAVDLDRIAFVADRRRAIELALKSAKEGDCVLIAGKGHESFQEYGDTVVPFDDRRVAAELLEHKRLGEGL